MTDVVLASCRWSHDFGRLPMGAGRSDDIAPTNKCQFECLPARLYPHDRDRAAALWSELELEEDSCYANVLSRDHGHDVANDLWGQLRVRTRVDALGREDGDRRQRSGVP